MWGGRGVASPGWPDRAGHAASGLGHGRDFRGSFRERFRGSIGLILGLSAESSFSVPQNLGVGGTCSDLVTVDHGACVVDATRRP